MPHLTISNTTPLRIRIQTQTQFYVENYIILRFCKQRLPKMVTVINLYHEFPINWHQPSTWPGSHPQAIVQTAIPTNPSIWSFYPFPIPWEHCQAAHESGCYQSISVDNYHLPCSQFTVWWCFYKQPCT